MKHIHRFTFAAVVLTLMISWSCSRFEDFTRLGDLSTEMEFNPSVVTPIAYGSFTLQDVLEAIDSTGYVEQYIDDEDYQDSLLYIYYTDTAYSFSADEVVVLPDKITTETYIESDVNIPDWVTLGDGLPFTFTKRERLDFEIQDGDQIDVVLLSGGDLSIVVYSEFRHSGDLTITSSQIYDPNGDSLDITFPISELDGSFSDTIYYDMNEYTFELFEENDTAFMDLNFSLTLVKEAGVGVDMSEEASIIMSFEDMEFSHIYGFVAEREVLNVDQTISIDFYDAVATLADVYFKSPEFNLYVDNSYGIPMTIDLSQISARSTVSGASTTLVFDDPNDEVFKINAPTVDELGQTVTTLHPINAGNSNIEDILVSSPDKIDFAIIASTGSPPEDGPQNFLLDTSKMDIIAELVLPMWLQTGGYAMQDTIALDFGSLLGDLSMIERIELTIDMNNELPLEVRFQGYFMDTLSGIVYDSLFDEGILPILESAPVDSDGELLSSLNEYTLPVIITEQKIANLQNVNGLWFKADASTTDNGLTFVKFYSHYELEYKVSIAAEFLINTSELNLGSEE